MKWIVIPAMGLVSAAAAIAVTQEPTVAVAVAVLGAALAAAVRALSADTPAGLVAAIAAPLLAVVLLAEHALLNVTSALVLAAIGWTIVELTRSPFVVPNHATTSRQASADGVVDAKTPGRQGQKTGAAHTCSPTQTSDRGTSSAVVAPNHATTSQASADGVVDAKTPGRQGQKTGAAHASETSSLAACRLGVQTPSPSVVAPNYATTSRQVSADGATQTSPSAAWRLGVQTPSPFVALLPATVAAVLEPAAIALVALAATRVVSSKHRWTVAVPIAGGLAVMLAIIAGVATDGMFATLGARWFGSVPGADSDLAYRVGDALGPLVAVAAIVGIALLARLRLAEVAAVSCVVGALLVDLRAGTVGSTTLGIASLCAALAIGRFAQTIRMPNLQIVAGATVAMMLLVPPAWTVILR